MGGHSCTVADGSAKHAQPETNILAMVLTGFEKSLSRHSRWAPSSTAKYYLSQFEAWGYTLSDVEHIITDHGQETEHIEPDHTRADTQAEGEELVAEETATD